MNKEKLQQEIDAMREKLAEMEAKLQEKEKKKEKKYFIPNLGQDYWIISSFDSIYLETNDGEDSKIYNIATGNCYRTEEEALKADAKQQAYVRIVRALRDHEEDGEERKCIIYYLKVRESYCSHYLSSFEYNLMMFGNINKELISTHDACEWVIDNMQDDLKIYFGE